MLCAVVALYPLFLWTQHPAFHNSALPLLLMCSCVNFSETNFNRRIQYNRIPSGFLPKYPSNGVQAIDWWVVVLILWIISFKNCFSASLSFWNQHAINFSRKTRTHSFNKPAAWWFSTDAKTNSVLFCLQKSKIDLATIPDSWSVLINPLKI